MKQPIDYGMILIRNAIDQERDDLIMKQWIALLPTMCMGKFVPFDEFKKSITDRKIDTRSTDEIMRELDEIERLFKNEKGD